MSHRRLLPALALLVLIAGCEDPDAKLRSETQARIDAAAQELAGLSLATATSAQDGSKLRHELEQIVRDLGSINQGDSGQQEAAKLMLAEARQRLASIDVAEIESILATQRRKREIVGARVNAALRLTAVADAMERNDDTEAVALLDRSRSAAHAKLDEYSATIAELDGPIAERMQDNDADRAAADRLRREANDLRRQANEAGHADGLADFMEAVRREREADGYDSRVAHREGDLSYDLGPRHAIASAHVQGLNALIEDIGNAGASLEDRNRILGGDVATTREVVGRMATDIGAQIDALESTRTGPLADRFQSAAAEFEAAASAAGKARGGDNRRSGALAAARAQDGLARLHALRLDALDDQIALLEAVVEAGPALSRAGSAREDVTALQSERTEALSATTAALTAANEQLSSAGGSGNSGELDAFRQQINARLAELGGATAAPAGSQE